MAKHEALVAEWRGIVAQREAEGADASVAKSLLQVFEGDLLQPIGRTATRSDEPLRRTRVVRQCHRQCNQAHAPAAMETAAVPIVAKNTISNQSTGMLRISVPANI